MDLSIPIQDTTLYIRVAGIIKTNSGYLFEWDKSRQSYIYTVGGKIKLNETSEEALKREVFEEIGFEFNDFSLCSVMENLFTKGDKKVHEICFIYEINDIFQGELPDGFIEVTPENIHQYDVRPTPMYDLIKNHKDTFKHIIQK